MLGPANCGWLSALNASRRYCKLIPSLIIESASDFDTDRFEVSVPGVRAQGNVLGAVPNAKLAGTENTCGLAK